MSHVKEAEANLKNVSVLTFVHLTRYALDPESPQLNPIPLRMARSRQWRSISGFTVTEHNGLPLARILLSDQASPPHPLAEEVVTMKGKAVVHQ